MLWKGLELLRANNGREINQLLFANDSRLVPESDEKLCRLKYTTVASECR